MEKKEPNIVEAIIADEIFLFLLKLRKYAVVTTREINTAKYQWLLARASGNIRATLKHSPKEVFIFSIIQIPNYFYNFSPYQKKIKSQKTI